MEALFALAVLLAVGFFIGRANEQRHFRELAELEHELGDIVVSNERGGDSSDFASAGLVVGSVVIAEDYFKRVAAAFRSLVGGSLRSYETLLERGRREAMVRMKSEARHRGAARVVNVRIETASLSENSSRGRALFSAEFIAYGTALVPRARSQRA